MINAVGKLIKDALFRKGKTQAWLAEEVGVSDNAVSKWIKTGQISRDNIPRVARLLGLYPDALLQEVSNHRAEEQRGRFDVGPISARKGKLVPLISWLQAGVWPKIAGNLGPDDVKEWIPCPVSHSPTAFVLRVRGESMLNPFGRPSFNDGDLIFIDPERLQLHGSLVIVRLKDDKEAVFRSLVIEGGRRYLKTLNPAWPEHMIEIAGTTAIHGVLIFKGEQF